MQLVLFPPHGHYIDTVDNRKLKSTKMGRHPMAWCVHTEFHRRHTDVCNVMRGRTEFVMEMIQHSL